MSQAKTTYEPPKCPSCGANLFRVHENVYETYLFNPETGTYSEHDGDSEIKCPDCGCDLYEVMPDGPCNYDAKNPPERDEDD